MLELAPAFRDTSLLVSIVNRQQARPGFELGTQGLGCRLRSKFAPMLRMVTSPTVSATGPNCSGRRGPVDLSPAKRPFASAIHVLTSLRLRLRHGTAHAATIRTKIAAQHIRDSLKLSSKQQLVSRSLPQRHNRPVHLADVNGSAGY